MAFGRKNLLQAVSGYMKHYKNVKLIGNEETNLSLDKIKESLTDVKNGNFDIGLYANGEHRPSGFYFRFGDNNAVHCIDIFDAINTTTSKPVNLHPYITLQNLINTQ